jgi:DNA-binding NtrC family response regulator
LQREDPAVLALVGSSAAMRDFASHVDSVATPLATTILLAGENGTGKGELAEYIHVRSGRVALPMVDVACAASAAALEAELVSGHAITGSTADSIGLIDSVRGGTVFLDEVSALSDSGQTLLLKAIEAAEGSAARGGHSVPVVIAATSRDLVNEVNRGKFREDLYYRLSATPVHVPPLRARSREDLADVITAAFNMLAPRFSNSPANLSEAVLERLIGHPWPGNLRELRNVLERSILDAQGQHVLEFANLPVEMRQLETGDTVYLPHTLIDVERAHIHRALHVHGFNRTHAANDLGISRATLIRKIKEYGLTHQGAPTA